MRSARLRRRTSAPRGPAARDAPAHLTRARYTVHMPGGVRARLESRGDTGKHKGRDCMMHGSVWSCLLSRACSMCYTHWSARAGARGREARGQQYVPPAPPKLNTLCSLAVGSGARIFYRTWEEPCGPLFDSPQCCHHRPPNLSAPATDAPRMVPAWDHARAHPGAEALFPREHPQVGTWPRRLGALGGINWLSSSRRLLDDRRGQSTRFECAPARMRVPHAHIQSNAHFDNGGDPLLLLIFP